MNKFVYKYFYNHRKNTFTFTFVLSKVRCLSKLVNRIIAHFRCCTAPPKIANNCSVGNSQVYNQTDDLGQEGNILKVRTLYC